MKKIFAVLMVVGLLAMTSCGSGGGGNSSGGGDNSGTNSNDGNSNGGSTTNESAIMDYFPHKVGSTWTYNVTSSNYSETQTLTIITSNPSEYIARYTFSNSNTVNESYWDISSGVPAISKIVNNGSYSEGALGTVNTSYTCTFTPAQPVFPSNLAIGSSRSLSINEYCITESDFDYSPYHDTQTSNYSDNFTILVVGKESITVPAGTFNDAIKLQSSYASGEPYYTWIVKNVGTVKSVSSTSTTVLQSYSIK